MSRYQDLLDKGWKKFESRPGVLYSFSTTQEDVYRNRGAKVPYCQICFRVHPIPFMVKNPIWEEVFPDPAEKYKMIVCPQCFEAKLGRALKVLDLVECDLNSALFWARTLES